jgi:hypothetical protein
MYLLTNKMEPVTSTGGWMILKNLGYTIPALLIGLSPESYMILTVFMGVDFMFGIMRAVALGGWSTFKSYKLVAGVLSKFTVLIVPLILVWAGRGAGFDFTLLGQWGIGALVIAQTYSILGHINAMRLGEDRSEWDAVSWVLRTLRGVMERLLVDNHTKNNG